MHREALLSRAIEEKTYTPRKMLAANGIPVEVFVTKIVHHKAGTEWFFATILCKILTLG